MKNEIIFIFYLTLILRDVASNVSGFNNCNRTLITRGGCLSEKLIDTPITVAHSTAFEKNKEKKILINNSKK